MLDSASEWRDDRPMRRTSTALIVTLVLFAIPSGVVAQWNNINFVDEFGDVTDRGARSATVSSIRPMGFPYTGTTATIFADCNRAWVRFSESPNLTGGDIGDGYTDHRVAVRLDGDDVGRWTVRQSWGDNDLRFTNGSRAISVLSRGSIFAMALSWFGEGSVAFQWSLDGSSRAIQESCD